MNEDRGGGRWAGIDGALPFGLALIVLGVLLALDNLEVVDAGTLLAGWWPLAVLAAGVWWLATGAPVLGVLAVLASGLLLTSTLELVDVPFGRLVVPGLLVVVGGGLLQAGLRIRSARLEVAESGAAAGPAATAVFGDARLVIGEGGADPGRVVATATAVLGDVSVELPAGWRIEDRITRLLGDVTLPSTQPTSPGSPVVELHGVVLFGDVQVRYVDLAEGGR